MQEMVGQNSKISKRQNGREKEWPKCREMAWERLRERGMVRQKSVVLIMRNREKKKRWHQKYREEKKKEEEEENRVTRLGGTDSAEPAGVCMLHLTSITACNIPTSIYETRSLKPFFKRTSVPLTKSIKNWRFEEFNKIRIFKVIYWRASVSRPLCATQISD